MFKSFQGHLPNNLTFLNNYNIQDKTLEHLMYLMLFEVESKGQNGPWLIDHLMSLFANYFIRHFSNYNDLINKIQVSSIMGDHEMIQIDHYIKENISNSITIEDLAKVLNVSKFHFLNEFKKYKGITPYQHLLNTRLTMAKDLLMDPNRKITSIAHDLGFSDSSHFSRSFKKATGTSPKVFREST